VKGENDGSKPSQYLGGTPQRIRCLAELGFIVSGIFKLVHDGSEGGSRFYTRDYQLFLTTSEHPEGEFLNTRVKFVYDLRTNWAEVRISRQGITELERTFANLSKEQEKCQLVQSGQPSDSIA